MSHIFDALQKSKAKQSGIDAGDSAAELLQLVEHRAASEHDSAVQSAESPFDIGTQLPSLAQPNSMLEPLQQESERDGIKQQPPKLEMEEKQHDEIMKFVQQVFLMPGAAAPRTVVLAATESGNGCSWI